MSTPGERGKQGDHGQAGDQGATGLPGGTGQRGPQGVTGQTGGVGERGMAGDEGHTGPVGRTGATGPPLLTRRQVLALLMVVVACFSLLAYRAEKNTTGISRNTQNLDDLVYAQCVDRRADVLKINTLYEGLIRVEEKSASAAQDPGVAAASVERIALYEAAKLTVPVCGPKP